MTNAPADLLDLRSRLQSLTGLSAVNIGIVGDAAHARTGGYHIGKSGLVNAGVWSSDYSVRLTRDRNGATESASAMDVGSGWRQGSAAWLRWNNLLVDALRTGGPALSAVRAVNFTLDGHTKLRTDREDAFRLVSTTDTVDIHTHIEWYRDTEGTAGRARSLDFIAALADQAITGRAPAIEGAFMAGLNDEEQHDLWTWLASLVDPNTPDTGRPDDRFHFPPALKGLKAQLSAVASQASSNGSGITSVLTELSTVNATLARIEGRLDALEAAGRSPLTGDVSVTGTMHLGGSAS